MEMSNITIDEVKKARNILEDEVLDLVVSFEKKTGIVVNNIYFDNHDIVGEAKPSKSRAIIEAQL
jgi:hypothetical protein